jgi:quinol-cytochrome oxidoreductase complex cytochrome b subunit
MVLLPFIDRSPERRPLRRPEVIIPALFMAFTVIFFALLGINRLYNL